MPGIIITYIHNSGCPVPEERIIEHIRPKFSELRKANGMKYKVLLFISKDNINKVIKNTLNCTGLFKKEESNCWSYKVEESRKFLMRNIEKFNENKDKTSLDNQKVADVMITQETKPSRKVLGKK